MTIESTPTTTTSRTDQSESQNSNKGQSNTIENIKVAVRLRPFTERERQRQSKRIVDIEQNTVALYNPKYTDDSVKKFTFDHSYWSHDGFKRNVDGVNVPDQSHPNSTKYVSQERVFEDLGQFLLENALQGYNSALLAYGQTGSGKSYTVSGYGQNEGILPRFARELFAELDRRLIQQSQQQQQPGASNTTSSGGGASSQDGQSTTTTTTTTIKQNRYEVYFSMIEIYNEVVRDLLAKQNGYNNQTAANSIVRRGLRVREHPKRGFFVESLTSYPCANKDEIESLIEEGQLNKSIAATSMNETSSRGHTIYEFQIRQFRLKEGAAGAGSSSTNDQADLAPSPVPQQPPLTPSRSRATPAKKTKPTQANSHDKSNTGEIETLTTSVVQLVDLAGSERMAVHVTGGGELGGAFAGDSLARPLSRSGSPFNDPNSRGLRNVKSSTSTRRSAAAAPTSASSSSSTATAGQSTNQSKRKQAPRAVGPNQTHNTSGGNSNLLGPNMNLMNSNHQQRFKESVSINQSLSALGNCIQVLSQFSQQQQQPVFDGGAKQPKIPYRDSVLTKLLNRCCLSGNSKVVLIATLSPADANYDDTLSTLRFADRAKQIKTHAVINRTVGESVNALQRENERLKQILDGRVTRSDDSSQTSNFDDSENMLDNFNGPKSTSSISNGTTLATTTSTSSPSKHPKAERGATVTKTRAGKATGAGGQVGSTATKKGPKNNLRLAQENLLSSKQQQRVEANNNNNSSSVSIRGPAGNSLGKSRGGATTNRAAAAAAGASSENSGNRLKGSASNPTLAVAGDQMEQLVSSAKKKMRQKAKRTNLEPNGLDDAASDEEYEQDEDDGDEATSNEQRLMRKSRSLGQGLADTGAGGGVGGNGEFEFGSELLDEIDLNELANIIDDENLLSPDSDDSFNNGASRAKFDENMSNEEKATILNRLLSNSSVANKIIRKQIESSISGGGGTKSGSKLSRPKKAGAKQHLRPTKRAELANSSTLKKSNPYLSNLNPDEQLTGMITYVLEPGEMIVGKDDSCDLLIYGPGLRGRHAKLTRVAPKKEAEQQQVEKDTAGPSECYIEPILSKEDEDIEKALDGQAKPSSKTSQAKRVAVLVNGEPILKRTRLSHGDRLLFGSTGYFVFVDGLLGTPPDSTTYDTAHAEVMRKMMSDSENEAMIKEIKDYTHRPGTGKKRQQDSIDEGTLTSLEGGIAGAAVAISASEGDSERRDSGEHRQQLDNIKEEDSELLASGGRKQDDTDELYRGKLMADTYDFAMPIAEANAIANEMGIKVTYGLKILTGEEQLEVLDDLATMMMMDDGAMLQQESVEGGEEATVQTAQSEDHSDKDQDQSNQSSRDDTNYKLEPLDEHPNVLVSRHEPIKPETLDVPPELYVHVHLDEFQLDFYWSKDKFQERRVKMLELYGAWDVGGKSGLVEYLIEQSKYQGYYMIDPFVDDIKTSWVLVGHAQVTLQPISHVASLKESFDVLDVDDEIVGSVHIEALPCHTDETPEEDPTSAEWPYKVMDESSELPGSFLDNPNELLDRKFVFLLRIVSCSSMPLKFAQVFCQYTLNRDQKTVRTKVVTSHANDQQQNQTNTSTGNQDHPESLQFDHKHFIVIDRVSQDILDFLRHGFVTIQLVGQYDTTSDLGGDSATRRSAAAGGGSSSGVSASNTNSAGRQSQRSTNQAHPTLVSTIISSINKYRFRMEQQSAAYQNLGTSMQYQNQTNSVYANSLTDSANSANYRLASSSLMKSNSGPSSVTSASATINLFDQQNDDDEGINSLNGANQENIIDMILTKRKLDRAENQLHYIKRTINIAEHHNKKHIPVRTVKKLLNSYGQELEGGSLEEMAAEVTAETKSSETKHSNCTIQ